MLAYFNGRLTIRNVADIWGVCKSEKKERR